MTPFINNLALLYTQAEMNLVILIALFAMACALILGIRIGVGMERKDPEPKPRKARKLVVVHTKSAFCPDKVESSDRLRVPQEPNEWFQPKNLREPEAV